METITRLAASQQQLRFFYTGLPCKNGHVARRYVSTGGCVECLQKFKVRQNPYSRDLVAVSTAALWRSCRLSDEQVKGLGPYLQQCVDTYCAHFVPPLCKTCDGTHYVPMGDGTANWKLCPDCPTETPTSAEPSA